MPKNPDKKSGFSIRKFRVGGRKGGKSAFLMSTAELLKALESADKSKYHSNIRHVLSIRGALPA